MVLITSLIWHSGVHQNGAPPQTWCPTYSACYVYSGGHKILPYVSLTVYVEVFQWSRSAQTEWWMDNQVIRGRVKRLKSLRLPRFLDFVCWHPLFQPPFYNISALDRAWNGSLNRSLSWSHVSITVHPLSSVHPGTPTVVWGLKGVDLKVKNCINVWIYWSWNQCTHDNM